MPGNKEGGLKAYATNIARDPFHYQNIGALGGSTPTTKPKGFAAMTPSKRSAAGAKGGKMRTGKKYGPRPKRAYEMPPEVAERIERPRIRLEEQRRLRQAEEDSQGIVKRYEVPEIVTKPVRKVFGRIMV